MSIKVNTFQNNECLQLKESSCIILNLYTTEKNNLWTAPVDFSRTRSQLNRHWLRLLIIFFICSIRLTYDISSGYSGQKSR